MLLTATDESCLAPPKGVEEEKEAEKEVVLFEDDEIEISPGDMALHLLPSTTPVGGRCLDGSMAGYYFRQGSDPSLFVINLKGGGACFSEADCTARSKTALGSSTSAE